ncbi:MAG: type II secretion system F family protein [Candidatus Omnitrophota bacterium]
MRFKYKAKKSLNDVFEGTMEADNVDQVIGYLERQGMIAVSIEEFQDGKPGGGSGFRAKKFGRWGLKQITLFTRKLYNLTKSRVELLSSLRLVKEGNTNTTEQALLEDMIKNIKDGMSFSQCLSRYPQYFSLLYINIIRTGESSGQLKDALAQVLTYLERLEGLRMKIKQALAYPIFMVVVGIGTIFVMMTFILPRLASIFDDFQSSLPLPTRILLTTADYLKQYWYVGFFFIILAAIILRKKKKDGTSIISGLQYRLPLVKRLVYKQSVANFSTSTALLLKSGVTLLSALKIVAPVIGNPAHIKQLDQAVQKIKDGDSFSHALMQYKIFPDFFIQMVKVGEEGGRLDSVLEDIAESYEQEIDADLKVISSLLEPGIILFLGLIIGGIVIAVLLPIFNINTLVAS